jgi:succinate dehydrogenase/fumarate reductase flavoprotein subunit
MGGIRVDSDMQTRVEGLYAAGEAVGGANGANRLSGNAITEALVFGERAGTHGAVMAKRNKIVWDEAFARAGLKRLATPSRTSSKTTTAPAALQEELQQLMWEKAGPFRTASKLTAALARINEMQDVELPSLSVGSQTRFNLDLQDWFELRAMLMTAEAEVRSALARTESRGAHQREDFPATDDNFLKNQAQEWKSGHIIGRWIPPIRITRNMPLND